MNKLITLKLRFQVQRVIIPNGNLIYKKTGKLSLIGEGYFERALDATVTGRGDIYFESYSSGLKAINSVNLKNMKKYQEQCVKLQ